MTNDGGSTVINMDSEMERVKAAIRKIKQPDYNSAGVNLNLSWEPDTLNLVTLSGNYNNFGHSYSGYSSPADSDRSRCGKMVRPAELQLQRYI